jgi:hypothetical protein
MNGIAYPRPRSKSRITFENEDLLPAACNSRVPCLFFTCLTSCQGWVRILTIRRTWGIVAVS